MQYRFGPYVLDVEERQFLCGQERVQLEPKVFDLLCYLLDHPGRLIEKQELIDSVWSGAAISDSALTRCVHQIRLALGDDAEQPVYLETVRGTGYRFIAPVRHLSGDQASGVRSRRAAIGAVAAFIVTIVAAAFWYINAPENDSESVVRRIAVLPLEDFSSEPGQEYFVSGIHEALISELSHIEQFDVISRSSVLAFDPAKTTLQQFAAGLGVDTVVEGSVARSGDNLNVSVTLVEISPERHLWADRFHRDVADVFEITTGIARAIAEAVAVELSESERILLTSARQVNAEAYDRYLQALFQQKMNPPGSSQLPLALFREAIEIDPDFAPAYAGLANAIGSTIVFGLLEPAENIPEVRRLADTALAIDSTLASSHLVSAAVNYYGAWDIRTAEIEARRALGLNPNFADAYKLLGEILAVSGRPDAALAAVERGRALDPRPPISRLRPGLILYLNREFESARDYVLRELPETRRFWQGYWLQCMSTTALLLHDEAVDACETAATVSRRTPMALGALGFVLARGGQEAAALQIAAELEAMRESRYISATYLAMIYGALGQTDRAMDELSRAFADGDINLVYIERAQYFDSLRDDARFQALAGQVRPASQE